MLMTIYNRKLLWDWTTAKTDLDFRYEQTIWFIKLMLTQGSIRDVFNGIGKLHFFLPVSFVLNTMTFREDKAGVRLEQIEYKTRWRARRTWLYSIVHKTRANRTAVGYFHSYKPQKPTSFLQEHWMYRKLQ